MDVSLSPPAPLLEPWHRNYAALEVVWSFLMHHVGELKGGYGDDADALADQMRELVAKSGQCAHNAGADSARP